MSPVIDIQLLKFSVKIAVPYFHASFLEFNF